MRYSASGTVHLSQQFREHTATNRQLIESVYGPDLERVERTLDLQHRMASQVHWMLDTGLAPRTDAERSAFALFHKNFFSFLGALTLLRGGLFGPARPLLRHVFESQVVAKFCLLSEDESLAIKWLSGDVIYLGREVFRKIAAPSTQPLEEFWGILSDYTHASVRSQQLELDVSEKRHWKEFGLTVVFLHMLTECNYHLLSSHLITRSMAYYAEHFVDDYAIPEMRRECRQLSSESHRRFAKGARALIATYRRRWEIRLPTTVIRTSPIIFRGSDNQDDSA